jgi:hypothetical protein
MRAVSSTPELRNPLLRYAVTLWQNAQVWTRFCRPEAQFRTVPLHYIELSSRPCPPPFLRRPEATIKQRDYLHTFSLTVMWCLTTEQHYLSRSNYRPIMASVSISSCSRKWQAQKSKPVVWHQWKEIKCVPWINLISPNQKWCKRTAGVIIRHS